MVPLVQNIYQDPSVLPMLYPMYLKTVLYLFRLVGLISTGIGIINLFPLPILDGGHLLLLLYEKVFSKKPSPNFMQFFTFIGIFLLLSLMIFATYNDLLRIIL